MDGTGGASIDTETCDTISTTSSNSHRGCTSVIHKLLLVTIGPGKHLDGVIVGMVGKERGDVHLGDAHVGADDGGDGNSDSSDSM